MYHTPRLTPPLFGRHIVYKLCCTSTNDIAAQLIHQQTGSEEGTVVLTDYQLAGRGQRGNRWHSQPYQNLTFSLILRPTFLPITSGFALSAMTALAIRRALLPYLPHGLKVKWPNDLYHKDKKLGGILITNSIAKQQYSASIIGIGINVNQTNFLFQGPTSLALCCGHDFSLPTLFGMLLADLEKGYLRLRTQGTAPLYKDYIAHLYWRGECHTFQNRRQTFQGIIQGIDEAGQLVVQQVGGTIMRYGVKDIAFVA